MRRLVFAVYALLFVTEALQGALVPILPDFTREFGLSRVEAGALLSATTFGTLVIAIPIGLLADRVGARRLAVAAGALLALSAALQGLAGNFWTLLAGRMLFGLAFGTIWTAGVAAISSATSRRRAAAVGGTITIGGLAHLTAPVASGYLADNVGVPVPFFALAVLAGAATAWLAFAAPDPRGKAGQQPLLAALEAVRGQHRLQSALALMGVLGVVAGVVPLLVPLQLSENGLSAGAIGALFSAGSVVWILASALVARLGERAVGVTQAGGGALALGTIVLLPFASVATAALGAFLLLRAACHAPLSTIIYPLAQAGARAAGIGGATVVGLANVVWAAAAVVGPLGAGLLVQTVGDQWAYGALAILALTVGAWILGNRPPRERYRSAEPASAEA